MLPLLPGRRRKDGIGGSHSPASARRPPADVRRSESDRPRRTSARAAHPRSGGGAAGAAPGTGKERSRRPARVFLACARGTLRHGWLAPRRRGEGTTAATEFADAVRPHAPPVREGRRRPSGPGREAHLAAPNASDAAGAGAPSQGRLSCHFPFSAGFPWKALFASEAVTSRAVAVSSRK